MIIREINAAETHLLRRLVLRANDPASDVHYPQDDDPASFHLGVELEGELVAVASFTPAATPYREGASAWQLRGMAVEGSRQGGGTGTALMREARERIVRSGASVLWCNARDTASGFYARLGFETHGPGFVTADSGLPHHVMVLDLRPPA